jgi:hypothetical protein
MAYLRGQVVSGSSTIGDSIVSGSLIVSPIDTDTDFFIIKSGSVDLLKANPDGVIQFHVYEDSYIPPVSLGGIYFHSSSFYIGLE